MKLKSVQKFNPQDTGADRKFYAQAVATGKIDLKRLAYLVSNQSSVREGDCYAVILSMVHNIMDELKQGKIVKLDRLGSFQLSVSSEGVATKEQVTGNLVKDIRINFRADDDMKGTLNTKTVKFTISDSLI